MSNKHKKTTVINRTTSETLRLGEVLPQSTSIQTLPVSRKKIQNSSSSFQITGVTRLDFGDDSADDLDESHTDDISRVTDNETPSFSEDSRDTDDHLLVEPVQEVKIKVEDDAGARFKVVKMPSATPFSRGRWTCFDYLDNSEHNLNIVHLEQKLQAQAGSKMLGFISPHHVLQQNAANKPAALKSQFTNTEPGHCQDIIATQIQKPATQTSAVNGQKDDILSDIKVALSSTPASYSGFNTKQ